MSFSFEDVSYSLQGKPILKDISANVKVGELVALMGPSGAGKTTLLKLLSHRVKADNGRIEINDRRLTRRLARRISYVLQEDVFFQNSTLKETLEFSARLRLPDTMSVDEKLQKVKHVAKTLNLDKCLNTTTKSILIGLGEKKRASIACELLTDPILLLLDEPTSGLDSTNALNLMNVLRNIVSTENRMAIVSIHQPSSKMFYMFDKLILLGGGKLAYFGRPSDVLDFFSRCGLRCIGHYNPADYILEKACEGGDGFDNVVQCYSKYRKSTVGEVHHSEKVEHTQMWQRVKKETVLSNKLIDGQQESIEVVIRDHVNTKNPTVVDRENYNNGFNGISSSKTNGTNSDNKSHDTEIANGMTEADVEVCIDERMKRSWPTSFLTQYTTISRRAFIQIVRFILTKLKAVQMLLMVTVVSAVWFQIPRREEFMQSIFGYYFFIVTFWSFTPMFDACVSFPLERIVFVKERSAGMFRISSYFAAKVTSEIPIYFIWPTLFFTVSYWCSGVGGFTTYIITLMILLVNVITVQAIGMFIGVTVKDFHRSVVVASVMMLSFMLLGGFYNQRIPVWLTWFRYVSPVTYSYSAMLTVNFHNEPPLRCGVESSVFRICQGLNTTELLSTNGTQNQLITADMALNQLQILLPVGENLAVLFGLGLFFRILVYYSLRYMNTPQ
ncbi:uncharacterized protein TRIADDRAFT_57389 [Trichoplax adhaerens]|uniref:ABC transporter domain-containing protein n=1 Tax=Trichoplax adhaerens TaxID=10228 RepID=B3RZB2_TRIAD|nr:hypothetical protein TRIADDRAFT_57389 [Trichoplax adhaerens]EDV23812.1 hypothetical protein TRIADDRAFT_57389 [Trichoplax adhaerens]|eukprot:XP_002113338.1 hypothetical protein TRIADDRAFT_57389 [Trichoplax adhaerens]